MSHDQDCPCWGDDVEHSGDCANCDCDAIQAPNKMKVNELPSEAEMEAMRMEYASRDFLVRQVRSDTAKIAALTAERDALKKERDEARAAFSRAIGCGVPMPDVLTMVLARAEKAESSLVSLRIALGEAVKTLQYVLTDGCGCRGDSGDEPLCAMCDKVTDAQMKIAKLSKAENPCK